MLSDPGFRAKIDAIMSKDDLGDDERRAGELLKSILEVERWVPRDIQGVEGMHDLDLVMADGSVIAVEVTTDTAGNRAAYLSEMRHNPIEAESLRCYWQIDVDIPADQWENSKSVRPLLSRIRDELEPILHQVEQDDLFDEVQFLRRGSRNRPLHPLCERLRELSIAAANALDISSGGKIWLQPPHTPAFSFDPNDIAQVASAHIGVKKAKLLKAKGNGAAEAHLFVWVPPVISRSPGATAAMWTADEHDRITAEVDLQGLDAVWVTSSGRTEHEDIRGHSAPVYRYDKHGWHRYTLRWTTTTA